MQWFDCVACDFVSSDNPSGRDTVGDDACDGSPCHISDSRAESYFEVVATDVTGTGSPRAKGIVDYEDCLSPVANLSPYRVIAHDDAKGRGWFSGKLHVAIASKHNLFPAVEDFSFDGHMGEVQFEVVKVPETATRFVQHFAGSGGGAIFHGVDLAPADVEAVANIVGNTAGYGDMWATPAVRLELQLRNVTLATSSAIPFRVSANLFDAKGQLVATYSRLTVDVHWPADTVGV